jgi:hypothetical protein
MLGGMILVVIGRFVEVFRILKEALYINLEMLIFFILYSNFEGASLWVIIAL